MQFLPNVVVRPCPDDAAVQPILSPADKPKKKQRKQRGPTLPTQLVEYMDIQILFTIRDVEVIIRIANGFEIIPYHHNVAGRVAKRITQYTGRKMDKPTPLLCWFAYAAGLVRL